MGNHLNFFFSLSAGVWIKYGRMLAMFQPNKCVHHTIWAVIQTRIVKMQVIGFGSMGPREEEEPARNQADGSTPWLGPHPRLLSCDVMAGAFQGFTTRHRNKTPPPLLPFHKLWAVPRKAWTSRTRRVVATWNSSLNAGWTRGPLSSFALLPRGCPSSSPATGRSSKRVDAVLQSCPHPCGPYFSMQKAAVRVPQKSP